MVYNECTDVRNGGKKWCSTENDADGKYIKWGNCDADACGEGPYI